MFLRQLSSLSRLLAAQSGRQQAAAGCLLSNAQVTAWFSTSSTAPVLDAVEQAKALRCQQVYAAIETSLARHQRALPLPELLEFVKQQ